MTKKEEWADKMKDYPCYSPLSSYFGICCNMGKEVKRYDCDKCVTEKGLVKIYWKGEEVQ